MIFQVTDPAGLTHAGRHYAAGSALHLDPHGAHARAWRRFGQIVEGGEQTATLQQQGSPATPLTDRIKARATTLKDNYSVAKLRDLAKSYGLDAPTKLKEAELIDLIIQHEFKTELAA